MEDLTFINIFFKRLSLIYCAIVKSLYARWHVKKEKKTTSKNIIRKKMNHTWLVGSLNVDDERKST